MTWTTAKPTQPGWYWWRKRSGRVPTVLKVYDGLWLMTGEWAGPIKPPEEKA